MNESMLMDLHAELQNDTTGARRAEVIAHLRKLHEECVAARRQPTDREAYTRLQAATVAVNAAIRIVETLPQQRGGGNRPSQGVTQS